MSRYLWTSAIILALQGFAYSFLRPAGIYFKYWHADIILHVLAGAMFASFFLWLVRKQRLSAWVLASWATMSAVFGSFLWELWEFGGWKLRGFDMPYYIPGLGDTLSDILAGLIGGVILYLASRLHKS